MRLQHFVTYSLLRDRVKGSALQNKPTAAMLPVLLLMNTFNGGGGGHTKSREAENPQLPPPLLDKKTFQLAGTTK